MDHHPPWFGLFIGGERVSLLVRLLLTFSLIIAGGFVGLTHWVRGGLRESYSQVVEESLVDISVLLSTLLEKRGFHEKSFEELEELFQSYQKKSLKAPIFGFVKSQTSLGVYVTDDTGKVLFSTVKEQVGKDFSQWNDVHRTLSGQYGARSTRIVKEDSRTSVYHVAAPIHLQGRLAGVATVFKKESSILVFLDTTLRKIFFWSVCAVILLILLSGLMTLWITIPLRELKSYALAVAKGQAVQLPRTRVSDLRELGQSMEQMRVALEGKKHVEKYTQALTHELKSPLTAIRGAAELSLEEMNVQQRERFLNNIIEESKRSHILLEQLLKLSELEAGGPHDKKQRVSVGQVVSQLSESMKSQLEQKKITLTLRNKLEQDDVYGDSLLLSLALSNLLQNALEFSSEKSEIAVSFQAEGEDLVVSVSDQGSGVPDFAKDRLFEKFYSLERPGTKKKGTGLGLSFVQEIAKHHRGTVWWRPGEAPFVTIFSLKLPRAT